MKVGVERIQRHLPHRLHHKITRPEYSAPQEILQELTKTILGYQRYYHSWIPATLPFSILPFPIPTSEITILDTNQRYYHSWLQPTILPFSIPTHDIIILDYPQHYHSRIPATFPFPVLPFSTTPILPFSTPITHQITIPSTNPHYHSWLLPTLPFLNTPTSLSYNTFRQAHYYSPFSPHIIPNHSTLGTSLINP